MEELWQCLANVRCLLISKAGGINFPLLFYSCFSSSFRYNKLSTL